MKLGYLATLALTLFHAIGYPQRADAARFIDLGTIGGPATNFSEATAVSADGLVIVGNFGRSDSEETREAFRWTEQTGMVGLGQLNGSSYSFAHGVSADGSIIVGHVGPSNPVGIPFIWTQQTGLAPLPAPLNYIVIANDVSADGSVVVGHTHDGEYAAIRWTKDGGTFGQPEKLALPSHVRSSFAHAISADGTTVVGEVGYFYSGSNQAFLKTPTKATILGSLPNDNYSVANDVSADGLTVVGLARSGLSLLPFRWTEQSGMKIVPTPHDYGAIATGVNADGSVIVGWTDTVGAFRWTAAGGTQSIFSLLSNSGVEVAGWTETTASAVSDNGQIVVGNGRGPNGQFHAWLADFSVPEPSSLMLAILSLMVSYRIRRR